MARPSQGSRRGRLAGRLGHPATDPLSRTSCARPWWPTELSMITAALARRGSKRCAGPPHPSISAAYGRKYDVDGVPPSRSEQDLQGAGSVGHAAAVHLPGAGHLLQMSRLSRCRHDQHAQPDQAGPGSSTVRKPRLPREAGREQKVEPRERALHPHLATIAVASCLAMARPSRSPLPAGRGAVRLGEGVEHVRHGLPGQPDPVSRTAKRGSRPGVLREQRDLDDDLPLLGELDGVATRLVRTGAGDTDRP